MPKITCNRAVHILATDLCKHCKNNVYIFTQHTLLILKRPDTSVQSWPKLCGTSFLNALPRPSISFSHGDQRSLGQILLSPPPPPLPPCNVVRKERLADESSNIAPGGKGGASENCSHSGKRHFVPHILARIVYITHFHYKRT